MILGQCENIYDFQKDFYNAYEKIRLKNKVPILCGGTGLYIESTLLKYDLSTKPAPNENLRASMENLEKDDLLKHLYTITTEKQRSGLLIDTRKQIIRNIEILKSSSNSIGFKMKPMNDNAIVFVTNVDTEVLRQKIKQRLISRINEGMIAEVKDLIDHGLPIERLDYFGLEYKFVAQYLKNEISKELLITSLTTAIRKFAKRQRTWFRRMEKRGVNINWIEPHDYDKIKIYVNGAFEAVDISGQTGTTQSVTPDSSQFDIGLNPHGGRKFVGQIDDFLIYNKVLDATEVKRIYNKIKLANKLNNYCYYMIPKFIVGMPLFNISKCSEYVYNELVKKGKNEKDNEIVFESVFKINDKKLIEHWELCEKYNIIDFELGNKVTGSGFPVYKGKGATLQRSLINYFLDKNTSSGYTEVQPPVLVKEESAFATGQLPDKEGQMYVVSSENLYLIPTAEVPITNIFRDVIIGESNLPIMRTGYTPCFRREAGSYGSDVRGLNRLHQFDKVEIVKIEHPKESYKLSLIHI